MHKGYALEDACHSKTPKANTNCRYRNFSNSLCYLSLRVSEHLGFIAMPTPFKTEFRNWVEYRQFPNIMEVDYHWADSGKYGAYWESMQAVFDRTLQALRKAQEEGKSYVLFTHGHSTSHRGKATSRSQVRKVMRSKDATPFIIRRECIQHRSVFVAAIKPLPRTDGDS